jgi:hypothetical protein
MLRPEEEIATCPIGSLLSLALDHAGTPSAGMPQPRAARSSAPLLVLAAPHQGDAQLFPGRALQWQELLVRWAADANAASVPLRWRHRLSREKGRVSLPLQRLTRRAVAPTTRQGNLFPGSLMRRLRVPRLHLVLIPLVARPGTVQWDQGGSSVSGFAAPSTTTTRRRSGSQRR